MLLYEFEGLELFDSCGINTPRRQLVDSPQLEIKITPPVVLKAQILSGKRADSGGIIIVDDAAALNSQLVNLFNKTVNGEQVSKVLVEEKITVTKEYYLSFSYDTQTRGPILMFAESGGTGIED